MVGNPAGMSTDQAQRQDALMQRLERRFFPGTRAWVCGRADGETLDVAIGTGLNLPHYPDGVRLTGVDHNAAALGLARDRARALGRDAVLRQGDATSLPYPDAVFDTVVCTFVLCQVPDDGEAIREALRVLRPDGSLLLADHVVATDPFVRIGQHLLEALTVPTAGDHFTRHPSTHLSSADVEVISSDRFAHGMIEQVHARKNPTP